MASGDKPPDRVVSGAWARSMRVTRMSMLGGARLAAHSVGNWVKGDKDRASRNDAMWHKQIEMWVREAGALKGSLLKAGQMLALYGEPFLPKEAMVLLRTLENQAPPISFSSIYAVLIADLGQQKVDQLKIEETPLGAASLGQVHKAIAPDGTQMALKVQYPGVAEAVDSDLLAIRRMLSMLRMTMSKEGVDALFDEVRDVLHNELDYVKERAHTDHFRNALTDSPGLRVPKTYADYSSGRVLATSFEPGVGVKSDEAAQLSQARRNRLGMLYFELYLKELFDLHLVQTDPHLGNFRIRIDDSGAEQDELVLLDFGATRPASDNYAKTYARMMRGCLQDNRRDILDAGLELGLVYPDDPPSAEDSFVDMCRLVSEPFSSVDTRGRNDQLFDAEGRYDYANSDLPQRVALRGREIALSRGMRAPPPETLFLDRKLAGTFHFLKAMNTQINARELLLRYLPAA